MRLRDTIGTSRLLLNCDNGGERGGGWDEVRMGEREEMRRGGVKEGETLK